MASEVKPLFAVIQREPLHAGGKRVGQAQGWLTASGQFLTAGPACQLRVRILNLSPRAFRPVESVLGPAPPHVIDPVNPWQPQFSDFNGRICFAARDRARPDQLIAVHADTHLETNPEISALTSPWGGAFQVTVGDDQCLRLLPHVP